MGSSIEINDTLQITTEQGFPADLLRREDHCERPVTLDQVRNRTFAFRGKPGARIFQLSPVRVYLVHNIDGRRLHWGRIAITSQSIGQDVAPGQPWKEGAWLTSGEYAFLDVYDPDYQRLFTDRESPPGLSYFATHP